MQELSYLSLIVIFILAGLVKGVTGMGLPTVAIALLSIFLPLPIAIALLVLPSLVTNVWQMFSGGYLILLLKRLGLMFLGIIVGTSIGIHFLLSIDATWASFALGTILIIYAVYTLFAPEFRIAQKLESYFSPIVGVLSGLIAGITGIFAIPTVPYLQALGLEKEAFVQALGLSFTLSTITLAVALWLQNAFHLEQLSLSIFAIFPALLGMWVGQKIRLRISPQRFKQCFLIFLVVLGVELTLRPFFL